MDDLKMIVENGRGSAMEFYKDSVILITGGTGFLGKVLIEKLLRCFEPKKIYLLMREKRNVKAKDRLKDIFQEPMFNVIRSNHPNPTSVFSKVIAIDTNFQNDQIISANDLELVLSEVTVVFNVMASVKFNESIDSALDTNVVCTRKLMDMVCRMSQLRSVVHVSTFYSNCDRPRIEEKIFEDIPFGGYSNFLEIFSYLKDGEKELLTPTIIGEMPNSYTFSKKCAEAMIQQRYAHLPISVFRPPIVLSAYKEPIPGWVDNFNGVPGMCVPMIQGKVNCAMGDSSLASHVVPVDYCVSALLAVGYETGKTLGLRRKADERVPVYNYATDSNNVLWGDYGKYVAMGFKSRLGRLFFGRYGLAVTKSQIIHQLFVWWLILQAFVADMFLMVVGKKRKHLMLVNRIFALEDATRYFTTHSWTVENSNMVRVMNGLSEEERKVLQFDIDTLDWGDYFMNYLPGIKAALGRFYQRRRARG